MIGGGDGAFENALMLAECCPEVFLLVRSKPRARADFVRTVRERGEIEIIEGAEVLEIVGKGEVEGVSYRFGGERRFLPVERVLIKIGLQPNSEWLGGFCRTLPSGHLWTERNLRTSSPRIWAIGDLVELKHPSLSTALGQACIAVREIAEFLGRA